MNEQANFSVERFPRKRHEWFREIASPGFSPLSSVPLL